MRIVTPLALACLMVGCASSRIDREKFDALYKETSLREGVLSSIPLHDRDADTQPPTVVNWWYVGTRRGYHGLIYRELTWNQSGDPVGREHRYRIAESELKIPMAFPRTSDSALWVPLYEAAEDVPLPIDLPTHRKIRDNVQAKPVENDAVAPDALESDQPEK